MGFFQAVASRLKEKKSGHAMKRYLGYSLQQSRKFESNIVHAINFVLFELFFTAYLELYLDRKCKNQKASKQTNLQTERRYIYHSMIKFVAFLSLIVTNNACNDLTKIHFQKRLGSIVNYVQ